MENRLLKVFSYWAMAMFLFVATLLVVHWTSGTVPWGKLDSGWVQAFGSIAAICGAIGIARHDAKGRNEAEMARAIVTAANMLTQLDELIRKLEGLASRVSASLDGWTIPTVMVNTSALDYSRNPFSAINSETAELQPWDVQEILHLAPISGGCAVKLGRAMGTFAAMKKTSSSALRLVNVLRPTEPRVGPGEWREEAERLIPMFRDTAADLKDVRDELKRAIDKYPAGN